VPGAGFECESIEVLAHNVRVQLNELRRLGYAVDEGCISFSMEQEEENPPCLYHRKYSPLSDEEKEEFWKEWERLKKKKAENRASK